MNTYIVIYQNYRLSPSQSIKGTSLEMDKVGNILIKDKGEIVAVLPTGTTVYKKE